MQINDSINTLDIKKYSLFVLLLKLDDSRKTVYAGVKSKGGFSDWIKR